MSRCSLQCLGFIVLLCLQPFAHAIGPSPDAGAMFSTVEQGLSARDEKELEGYPLEYYPRLRWTDEFSIQIQSIVINGNTLVPNEVLQPSLKGFLGKRMPVDRLTSVSNTIMKKYREAGHRAKAYVPEQSFKRGILMIQVIEHE